MNREDIRNEVIKWNLRFPHDRIWREKYKIPFGSPAHREANFLDQLFDLEEDKLYKELYNQPDYKPGTGEWMKVDTSPKTPEQLMKEAQEEMKEFSEAFKDLDE